MIFELNVKVLHEAFMKNILRENDTNTFMTFFILLNSFEYILQKPLCVQLCILVMGKMHEIGYVFVTAVKD